MPVSMLEAIADAAPPASVSETIADSTLISDKAVGAWVGQHLVVAISVDQFSANLFSEYRNRFRLGMKQLQNGVVYPIAYHSHAATQTCPGHSVLLTGDHPSRTGIIANHWYDLSLTRADKKVYCSEDPTVAFTDSKNYKVSIQYLKVPTLGDRMKALNPHSRVISIAGKDRAALMMGGHSIDQAWFWRKDSYVTLPDQKAPMPASVKIVNEQINTLLQQDETPIMPSFCADHALPLELNNHFIIGKTPVFRKAGDFKTFRSTPDYDRSTTDIAVGLIDELKLGHGNAPDLLTISLSGTDVIGHKYGTEGAEMCTQMAGLDENIAKIIAALDRNGVPYVLMLTADHGGLDTPERANLRGIPTAQRVDARLTPSIISSKLADRFHLDPNRPLLFATSPHGDWYISRDISPAIKTQIIEAAKAEITAYPQVAAVFTASELNKIAIPTKSPELWTLAERARGSFDPLRSGDLIVLLKPRVTPIAKVNGEGEAIATHGSPWNYDRRVPILFYAPNVSGFEQPMPVETVDIMPTLSALIQLPLKKGEVDGRCLDLDPGKGSTCPTE